MLKIGEIKLARDIGRTGTNRYIWCACPCCHSEHWGSYSYYLKMNDEKRGMCRSCSQRELGKKWYKEGAPSHRLNGYVIVKIREGDPYFSMAQYYHHGKTGLIKEHRLIMASHLGRCLTPLEIVHHKNGIKDDNRLENLEITISRHQHAENHIMVTKSYLKELEDKIDYLQAQLQKYTS